MAAPLKLSIGVTIDAAGAKSGGAVARQEVAAIGGEAERTSTKLQQLINTSAGLHSGPANNNIRNWTGALASEGLALDSLRAKYNPLFAVIRNYKTAVTEMRTAHAMGALSSNEFAAALGRERQATLASIDALKGRNAAMHGGGVQGFQTANIGAQFQDIVVTAGMGMDPLQIALQQGTQLSAVLGPMGAAGAIQGIKAGLLSLVSPVSLVTMGLIAGGVAAYQYFSSASSDVKSLDDVLANHKKNIDRLEAAYGNVITRAKDYASESRNLLGSLSRENLDALQASRRSESNSFFDEVGDLTAGNIRGKGDFFADSKWAAFEESLKNLRLGVKAGKPDFDAFWASVNRIGEVNPEYRKLADTLILTSTKAAEANKALLEQERILKALTASQRGFLINSGAQDDFAAYVDRQRLALRAGQKDYEAQLANMNARSPAEKAAAARLAASGERDEAGGKVDAQRVDLAGKLALAQAEKTLSDAQRDRLQSLDATLASQRLDLSLIGQTVSETERLRMQYQLTSALKEEAAKNGVEVEQAELDLIRQKSAEYGKLAEQIAAANALRGQEEQLVTLRTELAIVGESERVRSRMLAQLETEQEIRRLGISTGGAEAEMMRRNSRLIEEQTRALERQRDAWGEIRAAGEDTIDTLVDKFSEGDFKGAFEDITKDWTKSLLQLGVANPLKNAALGTNLGTLNDVGGIGGIFSKLLGGDSGSIAAFGQTVGAMTVSAGTVMINGGIGTSGSVLGGLVGANDNTPGSATGSMAVYRQAIAAIESKGSGGYSALGPMTSSGDRAYGNYQVMGANIPSWTKEALGKSLTPNQFLQNPGAQDAVFDKFLGKSLSKYGNAQDAASVWFTGRPQSRGAAATDILGTSGAKYVEKFNSALGKMGDTASGATNNLQGFGSGLGEFGRNLSKAFPATPAGGNGGGFFSKIFSSLFGGGFVANGAQATIAATGGIGLYANGGISDRPAIFGEGPMVEAAVPLPNGRSIPVDMRVRQVMQRDNGVAPTIQAGSSSIVIHNNAPVNVKASEETDERGNRRAEFVLEEKVASSISRPGSPAGRTLRNQYGLAKKVVRR